MSRARQSTIFISLTTSFTIISKHRLHSALSRLPSFYRREPSNLQSQVLTPVSDAAGGLLIDEAISHQESSRQEPPEQRLERPSSDTFKEMDVLQTLADKGSKIDVISTAEVSSPDPSPSSQTSIVKEDSPMPSSWDDSRSEDTYSSSPIVLSPHSSISPKRKTCCDASDQEDPSPKRTQPSVNHVTKEHPSTIDILVRLHAIYPILKEYTDLKTKKKKDIVIEHEAGFILSPVMTGAYDVPDIGIALKFCEAYEAWGAVYHIRHAFPPTSHRVRFMAAAEVL
ncbi:hypothetical protein FAGAP_13223 [Fusarium agapanthi]|uniref:Uncharacterized protein n=1 Tax=Fusarium agapanthi TaxID=1803897 RepID=A0A9P5E5X6_9HYPO|nr:hypothetical protein FAGAP_13223 [Fusarium agapanthi]